MGPTTVLACASLLAAAPGPRPAPDAVPEPVPEAATIDEAPPSVPSADPDLEITVRPMVWFPRVNGISRKQGDAGTSRLDVQDDLGLDSVEATFVGEVTLRKKGIWELTFAGYDFSADATSAFSGNGRFGALNLRHGDRVKSTFDVSSFGVELDYTLIRPYADGDVNGKPTENRTFDGRHVLDLRLGPVVNVQYVELSQSMRQIGVAYESGEGDWLVLQGGVFVSMQYRPENRSKWLKMFEMSGSVAWGPGLDLDGNTFTDLRASATWYFTEHAGVTLGYKLFDADVENDNWSFDGGLRGLFLAGSFQF